MKPIVKKNNITTAYKMWIVEERPFGKVIPIEFIGFVYNQNRLHKKEPKPFYHRYTKQPYIGELWKCYHLKTGELITCKFRHPVVADNREQTSLPVNENPVKDNRPNLLLDRFEEFLNSEINKKNYPNVNLINQNRLHLKRIEVIEKLLHQSSGKKKNMLFLLIRHKQTPTLSTLSSLKNFKESNVELYENVMQEINENV